MRCAGRCIWMHRLCVACHMIGLALQRSGRCYDLHSAANAVIYSILMSLSAARVC